MARNRVPNYKVFSRCSVACSPEIEVRRKEVWAKVHSEKRKFRRWFSMGIYEDNVVAAYSVGPVSLPLDWFVSSRWTERRTKVPLACDEETWHFAWQYWREAESYRYIKAHIEKYGMIRPIYADWYVNCLPERPVHRCFAVRGENLEWPFLIARTGNERLLMARYEWDWKTIPTVIVIRDCGASDLISALLPLTAQSIAASVGGSRWMKRPVEDTGDI